MLVHRSSWAKSIGFLAVGCGGARSLGLGIIPLMGHSHGSQYRSLYIHQVSLLWWEGTLKMGVLHIEEIVIHQLFQNNTYVLLSGNKRSSVPVGILSLAPGIRMPQNFSQCWLLWVLAYKLSVVLAPPKTPDPPPLDSFLPR